MQNQKLSEGHVRIAKDDTKGCVLLFDPPAVIQAIRIANKLIASDTIIIDGIATLPKEAVNEYKLDIPINAGERLIVNTITPTAMGAEWST